MASPQPQLSHADPNLSPVLQRASHDQLLPLVRYLEAGGITCRLSPEARREPEKHILELQGEIQGFGGNTFSNLFKGSGAPYRQVAYDVAEKKFAMQPRGMSVFAMEEEILRSMPTKGEQASNFRDLLRRNAPTLASEGFKQAGFVPYKFAVIIANKCSRFVWKRGLKVAANRAITAGLKQATCAFTGPVGWAITITDLMWTAWKAARPNLAVTEPCVIYIAALRRSLIENDLQKLRLINSRKRTNLILPGSGFWKSKASWAIAHLVLFIGCIAFAFWTRFSVFSAISVILSWLFSQLHVQTSFQPEVNETLLSIEQLQGDRSPEE